MTKQADINPDTIPRTDTRQVADPDTALKSEVRQGAANPDSSPEAPRPDIYEANYASETHEGAVGPGTNAADEAPEGPDNLDASLKAEPCADAGRFGIIKSDIHRMPSGRVITSADETNVGFDYAGITATTVTALRTAVNKINKLECLSIIDIGNELLLAKDQLPKKFGAWVKAEFQWSKRTAENYMVAAKVFGKGVEAEKKYAKFAHVGRTLIYRLASVPDEARKRLLNSEVPVDDEEVRLFIDTEAPRSRLSKSTARGKPQAPTESVSHEDLSKQSIREFDLTAREAVGPESPTAELSIGESTERLEMEDYNGKVETASYTVPGKPPLVAKRSPGRAASEDEPEVLISQASSNSSGVQAKKILVDAAEANEAAIGLLGPGSGLSTLLDEAIAGLRQEASVYP